MEYRLDTDEAACVKKLAEFFAKNETWVQLQGVLGEGTYRDPLELPVEKRDAILALMEEIGAIADVTHTTEGRFHFFQISPKVTQISRAIAEQENKKEEPRDIVEEIKTTVRSSRLTAWTIIAFFALATLLTTINQVLQILKTIGVLKAD